MPTAVSPIASPIRIRRTNGSGISACTGDPAYSKRVPKAPAEIMKTPRPAASMRYSGQCPGRTGRASERRVAAVDTDAQPAATGLAGSGDAAHAAHLQPGAWPWASAGSGDTST